MRGSMTVKELIEALKKFDTDETRNLPVTYFYEKYIKITEVWRHTLKNDFNEIDEIRLA